MRFLAALAIVAACTSVRNGTPPAPADAAQSTEQCEATFDQGVDRACTTAADCALLAHAGCCAEVEIGVAKAGQPAASSAETTYDACMAAACGARGCGGITTAEDGTYPTTTGQAFVAVCVNQRCTSTVQ
jgi:hypothetical protein